MVPQTLNLVHGVVVLEEPARGRPVRRGVAEFMFVVAHPKLRGANAAWVAALAVV